MPWQFRKPLVFIGLILLAPGCGVTPQKPDADEVQHLRALCDNPQRQVISRTASSVEEISVSPERGPRDGYGWDLFFARWTSSEFLTGISGGRYGGYKRVLLQKPGSATGSTRYHVAYSVLATGAKFGNRDVLGTKIEIFDTELGEKMAERTDYTVAQLYGSAQGCDIPKNRDIGSFGKQGLEFIHAVLNPPPGVEIVRKKVSTDWPNSIEDENPTKIAEVLEEEYRNLCIPHQAHSKPIVLDELNYEEKGSSIGATDRVLRFIQPTRDILVLQNLGTQVTLIGWVRDANHYVTVMRITEYKKGLPDFKKLLIRKFDNDGELIAQEIIGLPESLLPITHWYWRRVGGLIVDTNSYHLKLCIGNANKNEYREVLLALPK